MNISEHFTAEELVIPEDNDRIQENAKQLCDLVLEPIRAKWGRLEITSAFRCGSHNSAVGGEPKSFHLFQDGHAAADIIPLDAGVAQVFKWICLESGLPFDKAIMENENDIPACIHLQYDSGNKPRRQAFVGMTHGTQNGRHYTQVDVA